MTHLSDLIAALRKGDGNGCERSNWLMQEAADALMANQGAIVNSIIERTRHEATDDEREALAINYCPEHGDLLNRPDGTDARSHRCRNAHEIDEIHARFRRSEVPEPSPGVVAKLRAWIAGEPFEVSQARTGQPVAKVPETQQQGYVNGYSAAVEHVAAILDAVPQGEPSDAQVQAALDASVAYYSTTWVGKIDPEPVDFDAMRAALRAAGEVTR